MPSTQPTDSFSVLLARIFWMMLGPVLLVIAALSILRAGKGWFTPADFAFLILLNAVLLARWMEFRGGDPRTMTGEPATHAHFRHYVMGALLIGLGAWVAANLMANFWLAH